MHHEKLLTFEIILAVSKPRLTDMSEFNGRVAIYWAAPSGLLVDVDSYDVSYFITILLFLTTLPYFHVYDIIITVKWEKYYCAYFRF